MMELFFIPLLIGLICLWVGFRLGAGSASAVNRKQFRYYIQLLRDKIKSKETAEFVNDLHRTARDMAGFENATRNVTGHIRCWKSARFDAACIAYKAVRFGEFTENKKNEDAKRELISILDEIFKCAK